MIKNLSIRSRLIFVIGFMSLLLIAIGSYGLTGIAQVNASLKTVYDDRLVALGQLDQVARAELRTQFQMALSVETDYPGVPMDEIEKSIAGGREQWARYKATYLTPDEQQLAARFDQEHAKFDEQIMTPILAALRTRDQAAAARILHGPMNDAYATVRATLIDLIQLQLRVAKAEYDKSQADYQRRLDVSLAAIALGVALAAAIGVWLIRAISRPLQHAVEVAQSVAQGDLTREIEIRSDDETGRLLSALRDMNRSLIGIVGEVRGGTDTIAAAAGQIANGNLDLSSRTEQQASSLEETASSMEQLTSTVKQNADNARHANQLAASASDIALQGGSVVEDVVQTMVSIKDSSAKIVDIISVIDGIAFQTNILALNAAVEAARAGEQGRGFAVVATEVRNLAQRSAAAAKDIKALIGDSVDKVNAGSVLVQRAGATMSDIVASVRRVTDIMADISEASTEQTLGIEQVNAAVVQMDAVTQQNAALVEEAAAAAQSLEEQSRGLMRAVSVFKLPSDAPATVRAAAPVVPMVRPQRQAKPAMRPAPIAAGKRARVGESEWEEF